MPLINKIKNSKRKFKKREYRPWDLNGELKEKIKQDNITIIKERFSLISPYDIEKWKYKDRPENEHGDLQLFANELISIGQQQPCIVRPSTNKDFKYTLIIGERRWRASMLARIDLKVIIKNMSDAEAALSQVVENDSRKDLSEYAKGMSFAKLIANGILKQKDLISKLARSQQYISSLLSYSKIPNEIVVAVGDWSKVSTRTSETIVRLSKHSFNHIKAMLDLSDFIRKGTIGATTLEKKVKNAVDGKDERLVNFHKKFYSKSRRYLFSVRNNKNSLPSINFPKKIQELFINNILNEKELYNVIKEYMVARLKEI